MLARLVSVLAALPMGVTLFTWLRDRAIDYQQQRKSGAAVDADLHPRPRLRPSSHLDGLRGVAAFCVFIHHMSYVVYPVTYGYASYEPSPDSSFKDDNRHFLLLPFVRLLFSGPPWVAIFFVISGYVLSLKPIQLSRNGQYDQTLRNLSSSVFRRALRLYLPCVASTFIVFLLIRIGAYGWTRQVAFVPYYHRNLQEFQMDAKETFMLQLYDWYQSTIRHFWVWSMDIFGGSHSYDLHLWTIPVEFRCSMWLFLTQAATARMKPLYRLASLGGLCWFGMAWAHWEVTLFWAGMFLAELSLIDAERAKGPSLLDHSGVANTDERSEGPTHQYPSWLPYLWLLPIPTALYLLSYPEVGAATTPGYITLRHMVPLVFGEEFRFWPAIGAILLVWTLDKIKAVREPFNSRPAQFLGYISYGLYLMHGPVLHSAGYAIQRVCWDITGIETNFSFNCGFFLSLFFNVPLVVWAGDAFTKYIDIPMTKFAKDVELRMFEADAPQAPN